MAELTPSERLQPCLLDRLTDDEPDKSVESRNQRVFSLRQIRQAVLRDLSWLLNTPARADGEDIAAYPHVESSVLNYGISDLSGLTASGVSVTHLEIMVAKAIERFEPRILPATVKVRAISNPGQMGRNTLMFEISGDLWSEPMPDPLYLKTEVDLETGQYSVREQIGG
jgi:type VI secretion system protein ImpF